MWNAYKSQVRDVHFPKERTSRRRRHFCFVTFESMQVCQTCVLPAPFQTYYGSVALIDFHMARLLRNCLAEHDCAEHCNADVTSRQLCFLLINFAVYLLPWQAAERAVAESNREIGGYPVAAINIPTDRLTHYGLRQVTASRSRHCTIPIGDSDAALPAARGFGKWPACRFHICCCDLILCVGPSSS
jgi:hypothetical protein